MNPKFTVMRNKIAEQYFKIGNGDGAGGIWKELEDLGGGFNISHEAFGDREKKMKIAAKLREAAAKNILCKIKDNDDIIYHVFCDIIEILENEIEKGV